MNRTLHRSWLVALALLVSSVAAHAQFGFGVGIAAAGDNIEQAGGEVNDLFQKDSISYGDISGNIGFYGTGRVRIDLEPVLLLGDISYVYFQKSTVTVQDASVNTVDSTVEATLEVGTSMVPIYVGAAIMLPTPVVKPYVGAQLGYTYVSRNYTFVKGNDKFRSLDLQSKSAGDPEFGVALSAGAAFSLGVMTLDVGGRYNLANLFTQGTNEKSMKYLQVGASLFF